MAHVRDNCKNVSTTVSFDPQLFELVENHRFNKRKDNRSAAIVDLIQKGLKYEQLLNKKREKMLG